MKRHGVSKLAAFIAALPCDPSSCEKTTCKAKRLCNLAGWGLCWGQARPRTRHASGRSASKHFFPLFRHTGGEHTTKRTEIVVRERVEVGGASRTAA